jgi:hypothetical protein
MIFYQSIASNQPNVVQLYVMSYITVTPIKIIASCEKFKKEISPVGFSISPI